ncbi:protein SRG1-like [Rutidosis leptorrhynchoides]|uniref:protein SRG1-like n=1 Tax=Rutidosis leptorrhynchoides TaxID=125765 RepID=UPI003A9926AE
MEPKGKSFGGSLLVPSVQEVAKEPLVEVPIRYVRPDQDPPFISRLSSTLSEVPIIDMQRLLSEESANYELVKLHLACKDWGFFQMINHGVSCSLLEKLKEEIQDFFKLPMEDKKKIWQVPGDLQGYGQAFVQSEEQKLDWADMFYMIMLPKQIRNPRLFPNLSLRFRDTLEDYSGEVKNLSLKTLIFIAKALKMDVEEMKLLFDGGLQSLRMNYYPPCPQPEKVIGLCPHSDPFGITFLLQLNDVEGLQIKKDGVWMPIKPLPDSFIVNIADILEIMTNGVYKSIEHRAIVNSEKERLSISTFVAPKLDVDIGPSPSLISPGTPPRFTRLNFVDYLNKFFSKKLEGKTNIDQYYI